MTTTCDKCKKEFEIRLKVRNITIAGQQIYEKYFLCTKCKEKFISFYENDIISKNVLKIQQKRIEIKEILDRCKKMDKIERLKMVDILKEEIDKIQKNIKELTEKNKEIEIKIREEVDKNGY